MNLDLFSRHYGQDHPGDEPLLILHGLFGSSGNWNTIARDLALQHPVISLDLRNHGRSPHAPAMDYAVMADDIAHFMEQHDLHHAMLLGHSMGGKAAMQLALDRPALVSRLVVVDIAPVAYGHDYSLITRAMRAIGDRPIDSREQADAILAADIPETQVRGFVLQNLVRGESGYEWRINLDAIENGMAAITGFPHQGDRAYEGPVLFVHGTESDFVTGTSHGRIRTLFPGSRLQAIEHAGHWLHAENTAAFLAAVKQFLDED